MSAMPSPRPCKSCGRTCHSAKSLCKTCQRVARHEKWRKEIITQIQAHHGHHGLPPALRDVPRQTAWRAKLVFGSWKAAVLAAGFTPHRGRKPLPPHIGYPDRIPLTSGNEIVGWARVNPEDRKRLIGRRWFLGSDGYAYGTNPQGGSNVAMHRQILGLAPGSEFEVDHINGDRLDNRHCNLRLVTRAENLQNRTAPVTGRSRFRGVSWSSQHQRWMARASQNNRTVHLGVFDSELDAAVAAQRWRDEYMPFARPDPELVKALGGWPPMEVAA